MSSIKVNIPGDIVNGLLGIKKGGFLRFLLPYYNKPFPLKKIFRQPFTFKSKSDIMITWNIHILEIRRNQQ